VHEPIPVMGIGMVRSQHAPDACAAFWECEVHTGGQNWTSSCANKEGKRLRGSDTLANVDNTLSRKHRTLRPVQEDIWALPLSASGLCLFGPSAQLTVSAGRELPMAVG